MLTCRFVIQYSIAALHSTVTAPDTAMLHACIIHEY